MIKFRFTYPDGTHGYGFGLSEENIRRLKADQPIQINLAEMGLEGKALIFYGKDETEMLQWVSQFTDRTTVIRPLRDE